jgi:hypothetical protein
MKKSSIAKDLLVFIFGDMFWYTLFLILCVIFPLIAHFVGE